MFLFQVIGKFYSVLKNPNIHPTVRILVGNILLQIIALPNSVPDLDLTGTYSGINPSDIQETLKKLLEGLLKTIPGLLGPVVGGILVSYIKGGMQAKGI